MKDDVAAPPIAAEIDGNVRNHLLKQLLQTLCVLSGTPQQDCNRTILAAIDLLTELKPQGAMEGMLAARMIATHHAAFVGR